MEPDSIEAPALLAPYEGLNAPLDVKTFMAACPEGGFDEQRCELLEGETHIKYGVLTRDDFLFHLSNGDLGGLPVELLDASTRIVFRGGTFHTWTVERVFRTLGQFHGFHAVIARHVLLPLTERDVPEVDVLVTEDGAPVLAIEVSVRSLRRDREEKMPLYAQAGIPEAWIVNPVARQVEVRWGPSAEGYENLKVVHDFSRIRPRFAPGVPVQTHRLFVAGDYRDGEPPSL